MEKFNEKQIYELLQERTYLSCSYLQMKFKFSGEYAKKTIEEISKKRNVYSTYFNGKLLYVSLNHFTEIS